MARYALYGIYTPQKVISVNRDIKYYPPLSTWIEKVSGNSTYYDNQFYLQIWLVVLFKT